MPTIDLTLEGDNVWPDLNDKRHQIIHLPLAPWRLAALNEGMVSGKPSLALRLDFGSVMDGVSCVLTETSLAAWIATTCALRARFPEAFLGTQLFTAMGFPEAREFIYWGARPLCPHCLGTGWMPCQDQDLSIMRKSGACATCGVYSFVLVRTVEPVGEIEGSGRHYDDVAGHDVFVGAMPLVGALTEHLDRAEGDR